MKLTQLLWLQTTFAIFSLVYLSVSFVRDVSGDGPLSAAPIIPSMVSFGVYLVFVVFGVMRRYTTYRISMAIAVLGFGWFGVVMNVVNYWQHGLQQYSSFSSWVIAVAINGYGTIWNVMAMVGAYQVPSKSESNEKMADQ